MQMLLFQLNKTQYNLDKSIARKHILDGYIIAIDNVDEIIKQGLADVFTSVLEDAGVYKMDEDGIKGFKKFVNYTLKGEIL